LWNDGGGGRSWRSHGASTPKVPHSNFTITGENRESILTKLRLCSLAARKREITQTIVSDDYYTKYHCHRNLEVLEKQQKLMCHLATQVQV
jgi:hypothetical protein